MCLELLAVALRFHHSGVAIRCLARSGCLFLTYYVMPSQGVAAGAPTPLRRRSAGLRAMMVAAGMAEAGNGPSLRACTSRCSAALSYGVAAQGRRPAGLRLVRADQTSTSRRGQREGEGAIGDYGEASQFHMSSPRPIEPPRRPGSPPHEEHHTRSKAFPQRPGGSGSRMRVSSTTRAIALRPPRVAIVQSSARCRLFICVRLDTVRQLAG
jgi:hypothetical protein